MQILLVEDNDLDAERIERLLKRQKIEMPVIRARDGLCALDILEGRDGREPISGAIGILLDLNMPRMNGFEFLHALRACAQWADTPVFVLTTSDRPKDIYEATSGEIDGYIFKPIQASSLLKIIDRFRGHFDSIEN